MPDPQRVSTSLPDWIRNYPHVLALLQSEDDTVLPEEHEETLSTSSDLPDTRPESILAYLREVHGFTGTVSVLGDVDRTGPTIRLEADGIVVESWLSRHAVASATTMTGLFAATLDQLVVAWRQVAAQGHETRV